MNIHNIIHFVLFTFIFICTFFLFSSSPIKEANTNQESDIINTNSILVEHSIIQPIADDLNTLKEKVDAANTMIENNKNDELINIELREREITNTQSFIGIDQNEFKIVMEKMKDDDGNELPLKFKCILYLPTGNEGPKGPRGDQGPQGEVGVQRDIGPDGNSGTCKFY